MSTRANKATSAGRSASRGIDFRPIISAFRIVRGHNEIRVLRRMPVADQGSSRDRRSKNAQANSALASDGPPKYQRVQRGSIVDEVEPRIRELLQAYPRMPATVIAERIGWTHSIRVAQRAGGELRPVYLPPDPASRTAYAAGEIAQCDFWFPDDRGAGRVRADPQRDALPVLTMICGYSRWLSAVLIPTRTRRGPVRRVVAADRNAGCGATGAGVGRRRRGRAVAGRPSRTDQECQAFRGTLAAKVLICKPGDPEAKGLIERCHDYLERSFLPGRASPHRPISTPSCTDWLAGPTPAPNGCWGARPADRIEADRAAMLALPPVAPATGWRSSLRLPRDHYVRLDSNDYSVHPVAVGRRMVVRADLDRVQVLVRRQTVADHARVWATHQTISDPAHVEAAKVLRRKRIDASASRPSLTSRARAGGLRRRVRGRSRRGGGLMAATKTTSSRDVTAELAYLTRALKAPTLRESVARLAERARAENWSHEEYLAACLQREVSARESHGGEGRIRAARFPARKSLEEFDFDQPADSNATLIAHLGTLDFVTARDNVVFLGPPGTGKTHLAIGMAMRACQAGHRVLFATAAEWVARLADAHHGGPCKPN